MGEPNATDADPAVLLGREFTSAVVIFNEAVGQLLGLSGVERKCLDILDRLGTVSAGRIAEHTGLTTGAVTGMIDRLTRAGYVERIPNPADRRSVLIALRPNTPGDALLPTIFEPLAKDMTELASHYSPAQLATIADWVARTTEVLHRRTEALTASAARTQPGAGSRPERAAGEPRTTRGGAASSVAG
jgi:DNA-binding MarR family transcriptional regulator